MIKGLILWLTDNKRSTECEGKLEEMFFDLSYRCQYICGMSPVDSSLAYRVYRLATCSCVVFIILAELFLLCSGVTLEVFIDNISVTIIHLSCLYRFCAMIWNLEVYDRLAKAMESPTFDVESKGRQNLVARWAKKNRSYFFLMLTSGTCTLTTWYIYPLIDEEKYNFPVSIRLPFEYRTPERYPWTYACVLTAFHFISYFVITNDVISLCILAHVSCQFSVLRDCFRNALRDSMTDAKVGLFGAVPEQIFTEIYSNKLKKHICQHQYLLENANELKSVLSLPMLGQLLASTLLICFVAYQVTATATVNVAKFLMTVQYLAYTLLQLYVLCRWCNEINVQSELVGESAYDSHWQLNAYPKAGPMLQLVMVRSQRSVVLTAGQIYDLSLKSYMTLVKTSYSALTVLLRTQKKSTP